MSVVDVIEGDSPVILGLPHTGTDLPPEIARRLNENGQLLADTDWHVHQLYDGLLPDATTVRATFHRYVIDANRDPSGLSLYPGQNTTGLVPKVDFDNQPIWRDGAGPGPEDIAERLATFHEPYHTALRAEIERVRARHGVVILYDCHSIRSGIPFLFEGRLPDFNIGDNVGVTCDGRLTRAVEKICAAATGYTHVVNGRFKGGWTTRTYGNPDEHVHALQMELAQRTHLASETPPFAYDENGAGKLAVHLSKILHKLEDLALNALT